MSEPWLIRFFACNREMQPFSFFFVIRCWGGGISGRVRALNLTVPLGSGRVGSDDLGYGPGSGFSFEPVQISIPCIIYYVTNKETLTLTLTSGAVPRVVGTERGRWNKMIMNDTCTTHRSRVPRRSFGRIKGGETTVEDERGPDLDFILCFVCGSRPWGAAAFILCLVILLLKS